MSPEPPPTAERESGRDELPTKMRYTQKLAQTPGFGEVPPGMSALGWVNIHHLRPQCFGEEKKKKKKSENISRDSKEPGGEVTQHPHCGNFSVLRS